ncbi:sugar transferase [Staphylococcus equorum]|uniref:sugar transferase n=1 Tax=Staphylococcus equorum TaxID=246432 RepID=UPI000853526D|nr:sugar transferase [Staphylococcus equorum]OEK64242.1 UDP-phosphate galactose phosphotransferase [Staphylococcus equorum]
MYANYFKRYIDLVLGILLAPVIVIFIFLMFITVKLDDKGPVFYKSKRLGKDKKVFSIIKFRSMKIDAPDLRNEDGSTFNSKNDPRITKIGKFIRKTSIDELPQVINVIKGDMSFVGPRPDTVEALNIYEGNQVKKLDVRPGITGYNQAYYRNSISQKEKFQNDIYYVKNISFLFDMKIILKTIHSVLNRKNINSEKDGNIEKGN